MGRSLLAAGAATGLTAVALVGLAALLPLSPGPGTTWYAVALVVLGAVPLVLGWLVLRRARVVGALLCWTGVVPVGVALTDVWAAVAQTSPDAVPAGPLLAAVHEASWVWLYVLPALVVLHFPDGRLPGPRWRAVPVVLVTAGVAMLALSLAGEVPVAVGAAVLLTIIGGLVATAASVVVRRQRTQDPVEREQLRWMSLTGLALPAALLLCWASYLLLRQPDLVLVGLALAWVVLPVATWVAVVHHGLYDVDRVRSTVVVGAIVTGAALLGWTAATVTVGALVGGRSPALAAAVAAVLVLALLPLVPRLSRAVERRLWPQRAVVRDAVLGLLRDVRAGTAAPELLEETLRGVLGAPGLRVAYGEPAAVEVHDPAAVPVRLGDRTVALLTGVPPAHRAVLADVEGAVAQVAELARMRAEVVAALRETEESRRRLQAIGYEERRRLERDLHDGAQQRLVSLGMNLRVAQRHLAADDQATRELIDTAVAELGTAVGELRQLAHGIRPACLDDGLGPALAPLGRSGPVPVSVRVAAGTLPDPVATTAYYVVMEAVTNAVKHASSSRIAVEVEQRGAHLAVLVEDDGSGGADSTGLGAGLAGLRDRVTAAGGTFALHSPPGRGTRLEVLLPCA